MKIYHYGRRVNGQYDSVKSFVKRSASIASIATISFFIGAAAYSTNTTEYTAHAATLEQAHFVILDRIADCESGNGTKGSATQYQGGQVLMRGNVNKTVDIGKYQINLGAWGKTATKLGYDLTTTEGNTAMAEWIYLNKGTGAWYSSENCWNK